MRNKAVLSALGILTSQQPCSQSLTPLSILELQTSWCYHRPHYLSLTDRTTLAVDDSTNFNSEVTSGTYLAKLTFNPGKSTTATDISTQLTSKQSPTARARRSSTASPNAGERDVEDVE